eukprot:TRINITY_DN81051_c0_g1_i1.p1 TRINITY_DN81051_c0_g1~~TRINITY_DN81051_c0_g1_i1.p1  ORF type:complete len:176 (-),score=32.86 TRINITY_DN81051_c0_g1_i1:16-519(-)
MVPLLVALLLISPAFGNLGCTIDKYDFSGLRLTEQTQYSVIADFNGVNNSMITFNICGNITGIAGCENSPVCLRLPNGQLTAMSVNQQTLIDSHNPFPVAPNTAPWVHYYASVKPTLCEPQIGAEFVFVMVCPSASRSFGPVIGFRGTFDTNALCHYVFTFETPLAC